MKLIHTADLHLGSKIESKFPASKSKLRRTELRNSFSRMIDRAKELGAEIVLIAGDAFDTAPATPADADFFFGAIKANPDLTFLYLHGNHDAGVPFPAGTYDALQVVLGAGAGHNWWCVLFPPLCVVTRDGAAPDPDEGITFESDILAFLRRFFDGRT